MKLETKRLILRQPAMKDAEDITENINNLKISRWLLVVPYPYKIKDAKWYINHCKKKDKVKPKKDYNFGIELKSEQKIIGGISISHIDFFQGTATIGYWLGEKYWRKGYGSEAIDALLKFAFKKLKLRRLEAGVFEGNPSSGKLLEKFGFKKEGLRIKSKRCKADGKLKNEVLYALLKSQYKK